jgi:exo-beta-1,3-glucanase (GH17 family)
MTSSLFGALSISRRTVWRAALPLLLTAVIAACGGGGTVPASGVELRALSADFATRKMVSYSPFRSSNRDTEVVTAAMVKEDLSLLLAGGFNMIRLFDSSDSVAKLTLQVIQDNQLDMKVMLGAYVASESKTGLTAQQKADNQAFNKAEMARAIALANDPKFKSTVLAVSVGNEAMVVWSDHATDPAIVAAYIKQVRAQITQPVTTDDDRAFYTQAPGTITDVIDFASVHTYPLAETISPGESWDWQQQAVPEAQRAVAMMDAAIARADFHYKAVRAHLDSKSLSKMPIIIGETGWKAEPNKGEFNRAHPVNQGMYFERLKTWADKTKTPGGPLNVIYFEAFDEPWKGDDDKWALFTVARKARYMVEGLYPAGQLDKPVGTYKASDAVYAPTIVATTITANRYTVYADTVTTGEAIASNLLWFGFDSPPNAFTGEGSNAALAAEGTTFREIQPAPANASAYGWGLLATNNTSADLSQFTGGRLNLSIKTTYPGKLMIGFITTGTDGKDVNVSRPISNTNADGYGFVNDGQWHQVSIPVSYLTSGQATVNLGKVTFPIVISDIYATTGNTTAKGDKTKIFVDGIYWSK